MIHRVPDNLVGDTLRKVRQNTDEFNKFMMSDGMSKYSNSTMFPLTTN